MGQPTGFKTFIFVFIFVMFSASIFSLQNINTSDSPIYPLIHYDNVFQITCDWEHAYVGCSAKENSNIGTVWRELLLVTRNTGPSCRGITTLVIVIVCCRALSSVQPGLPKQHEAEKVSPNCSRFQQVTFPLCLCPRQKVFVSIVVFVFEESPSQTLPFLTF